MKRKLKTKIVCTWLVVREKKSACVPLLFPVTSDIEQQQKNEKKKKNFDLTLGVKRH